MNTHAEFPPSALRSWEICPGFEHDGLTGSAAIEGTLLHKTMEAGAAPEPLTPEQQSCIDWCHEKLKHINLDGFTIFREVRLHIPNVTFGTSDVVAINGDFGRVLDWKFGRKEVMDAEHNVQGQAYALGAFYQYPELNRVEVFFLMPRLDLVTSRMYARSEMDRLQLRIETIIARRKAYLACPVDADLHLTQPNCLYCHAKAKCPKVRETVLHAASRLDETLELPEKYEPSQLTTPTQIKQGLKIVPLLEAWCKRMKDFATETVLNGTEIEGYDLVRRSGRKTIPSPLAAYFAIKDEFTLEEFISCCSVSPSELESVVGQKAPRGKKTEKIVELRERLSKLGLVIQGETTTYLQQSKK